MQVPCDNNGYRFHLEAIKRLPGQNNSVKITAELLPAPFFSAHSNVFLFSVYASFCFSNKHETFRPFSVTMAGENKDGGGKSDSDLSGRLLALSSPARPG